MKQSKNSVTFEVNGQLIRRCSKCKTEKPLTTENFSRHVRMSYGFRYWCKPCCAQKHIDNINKPVVIPDLIVCRACGVDKPNNQFAANKRNIFKREYNCIDCNIERAIKKYDQMVTDGEKVTCYNCLETKPVLSFSRSNSNGRGVASRCKECDNAKTSAYKKLRMATDPNAVLEDRLRSRISKAIRTQSGQKEGTTIDLLGAEVPVVRQHLENQFQDGMTWENHSIDGWHIDHIIPCASFDLTDPAQQKLCFNYTNLQPLWAPDNLYKSDKIL